MKTDNEEPKDSVVPPSTEAVVKVMDELHICYDYCATWKDPLEDVPNAQTHAPARR